MSRIIGIDLGTTNSLAATVDSGIPIVIADKDGRRLTPSVVNIPGPNSQPVVGHAANRIRMIRPAETIYSVKRFIGRRGVEVPEEERTVMYLVEGEGAKPMKIPVHGRRYSPEEISAEILKKVRADAEFFLGEPATRAVITVPAYFNDAQRNATKAAAELAGLTVERIINEPTAAALAYGLDRLQEKSKIAVYDLGGGTFDLSILELNNGVFQVLASSGNTQLGGDDIDRSVMVFLIDLIKSAGGPDLTQRTNATISSNELVMLSRIRDAAEQAKIDLSFAGEVEISLPFLTNQFSFSTRFARHELELLAREVVERTRVHCLRSLADAKLEAKDLDQVILVGGQTRMPLVRQLVSEWFGCQEFTEARGGIRLGAEYHRPEGPQLNTSQNPDEAVALGAAIQAEILAGGFRNVLLLDVTPLSLGVETFGGLMNVIIPRNTTIPVKAGEIFTTAVDNQREMLIHVLQGERDRAKDNWSLGQFTLDFEPAPRGIARVGVQFEIDNNGILHVLARDTRTGKEKILKMKSAVDVDDAAVQQMVEESVEHAFEDLAARRWIETKLKANELIAATRKGLADCGDHLNPQNRIEIETALQNVESILSGDHSDSNPGDSKQLQGACAVLDRATKPMADLLMDRAMEAILRKRGLVP